MSLSKILRVGLVAAAVLLVAGMALEQQAAAQTVVYPATSIVYPASTYTVPSPVSWEIHYHTVRSGTYWHWTPEWGWHEHDRYVYVPHWTPTYSTSGYSVAAPIVTYR